MFPQYTKLDQADREIRFASNCVWAFAGGCFCFMVYRFVNSEMAKAFALLLTTGFWVIAGWRLRRRSLAWAIAAVVCYPLMLPVAVPIFSLAGFVLIWLLYVLINGLRATRAYRRLSVPSHAAQSVLE